MRCPFLLALSLSLTLAASPAVAATAAAARGMVATEHRLSSRAGAKMLERGGNAVDAIVAAAFASGVVNPTSSGIGGGGFLVLRTGDGMLHTLDFRETAPAAARRDLYVRDGKVDPALSLRGGLAVAVPGEVRGLAEALERWGSLPLATVLEPAIRLADKGFPVGSHLARTLERRADKIREWPALAAIYLDAEGNPWKEGALLRSTDLAQTLRAIARSGPDAFYGGVVAERLVAACREAGGILTAADLAGYSPKSRPPLRSEYRGHTIVAMGPPSSGGGVILEILNILAGFSPATGEVADLHRLAEASKLAFADRAVYYGDSDFVDVPLDRILSEAYATRLRARIDSSRAMEVRRPAAATERGGTSHLSAIDRNGFAAALTTTINTAFGSMVVAPGTGVILNNEMDDFVAAPGAPNVYGLVGSEANSIAPRKRPLSSMSPTLVLRDDRPILAVGGSGGPLIISATLQVILNVIDADQPLTDAVAAPRVHHQWQPPKLFVESELGPELRTGLEALGHSIQEVRGIAAVQAVQVTKDGFVGVSDDRKGGVPAGW